MLWVLLSLFPSWLHKQMEDFRRVFDFSMDEGGLLETDLAPGEAVRVVRGTLAGVEGNVMEIQGKTYVVVGLPGSVFARARIPRAWLERTGG